MHHNLGGIPLVRFVASAGAGRWLVGGDSGVVAEYSRAGITRLLRSDDTSLTFHDASGELADLARRDREQAPVRRRCSRRSVGNAGLKPLPVRRAPRA